MNINVGPRLCPSLKFWPTICLSLTPLTYIPFGMNESVTDKIKNKLNYNSWMSVVVLHLLGVYLNEPHSWVQFLFIVSQSAIHRTVDRPTQSAIVITVSTWDF